MRRITALWESFYSGSLYSEAFHSWKGIGFLSLALLAFIHAIVFSVWIHTGLKTFVNYTPPITKQLPPVTFKDGKASTPEAISYEIKAPETGELIAIIDTRTPHPPADLGKATIYVAGESMAVKDAAAGSRPYDYKSMGNTTIDEKTVNNCFDFLAAWGAAISFPFILGFFLLWNVIQLILFSLITLIAASTRNLIGSYAAILRLTSIALITSLVLEIIFSVSNFYFFGISLLTSLIALGYIIFGVFAVKSREPEAEIPPAFPR